MTGESMTAGVPSGHRQPQQSRSRETVERILTAADEEIGEVGLGEASTTSIARRAGLSVGAVYRFFKDKDEIATALANRYLERVWEPYQRVVGDLVDTGDVAGVLRALVVQAANHQAAHPGYYRLADDWDNLEASPTWQVHEDLCALFTEGFVRGGLAGDPEEVRQAVGLCIHTVRHSLVRAPSPEARRAVVEELKIMLPAYIQARFPRRD